ncbi:MAG: 50S ribosomal protein L19 [Erysipelotrichaceae bacterium]|nr:50S ribosomal protein L19 [Erysipelotrichaceae bacterium]
MNMNLVKEVTANQIRSDIPEIRIGDTVVVGVNIIEGNKKRVQDYQGLVIKQRGEGVSKSFVVRKISNGVGVERVFPVNSPMIAYVKVVSHGKVRRAKLYYLRKLKGKASKVAQKI